MLTTLNAALAFATLNQKGAYTLTTDIKPWSTARFEVVVNGQTLRPERRARIDLMPYLRSGENTVEVRYHTRDGKPSLHQPAILQIESADGVRMRLAVSLDNPKGRVIELLVFKSFSPLTT